MNEDIDLNDFVRNRLENGLSGDIPHFDDIIQAASSAAVSRKVERRRHLTFWRSSLIAASFAAICSFAALCLQSGSLAADATIASALDLLRAADGVESAGDESSVADMLLAWQDAPYESAVSDILALNVN